jgi:hypothetical protein
VHEHDGPAPLQLVEQRSEARVAQVGAAGVAEQHDAIQPEIIEGIGPFGERAVDVWPRQAGKAAEPVGPVGPVADHLGRELAVWQPLNPGHLAGAVAAATTPQARVCVVLAAVHAARPGAIRALQLDDVDLVGRRLRLAGKDRPIGELTRKVLREWLEYRHRRWPHTANPRLLISKESALRHGPVSSAWILNLRGLPATLERLQIDCQLTEAMATGFDPLHLAEIFGISEQAAIRYAVNARQLLGPAHQAAARSSPATPRPAREYCRPAPGGFALNDHR